MRRICLLATALIAFAVPSSAAISSASIAPQSASLQQREDGSEYVWRVFCNSGLKYSYMPASQFPASARFEEVTTPQTGDIAWWPEYVAIFVAQNQSLITAAGYVRLADLSLDGNQPHYYRMRVMPGEKTGEKPASGTCERNLL